LFRHSTRALREEMSEEATCPSVKVGQVEEADAVAHGEDGGTGEVGEEDEQEEEERRRAHQQVHQRRCCGDFRWLVLEDGAAVRGGPGCRIVDAYAAPTHIRRSAVVARRLRETAEAERRRWFRSEAMLRQTDAVFLRRHFGDRRAAILRGACAGDPEEPWCSLGSTVSLDGGELPWQLHGVLGRADEVLESGDAAGAHIALVEAELALARFYGLAAAASCEAARVLLHDFGGLRVERLCTQAQALVIGTASWWGQLEAEKAQRKRKIDERKRQIEESKRETEERREGRARGRTGAAAAADGADFAEVAVWDEPRPWEKAEDGVDERYTAYAKKAEVLLRQKRGGGKSAAGGAWERVDDDSSVTSESSRPSSALPERKTVGVRLYKVGTSKTKKRSERRSYDDRREQERMDREPDRERREILAVAQGSQSAAASAVGIAAVAPGSGDQRGGRRRRMEERRRQREGEAERCRHEGEESRTEEDWTDGQGTNGRSELGARPRPNATAPMNAPVRYTRASEGETTDDGEAGGGGGPTPRRPKDDARAAAAAAATLLPCAAPATAPAAAAASAAEGRRRRLEERRRRAAVAAAAGVA